VQRIETRWKSANDYSDDSEGPALSAHCHQNCSRTFVYPISCPAESEAKHHVSVLTPSREHIRPSVYGCCRATKTCRRPPGHILVVFLNGTCKRRITLVTKHSCFQYLWNDCKDCRDIDCQTLAPVPLILIVISSQNLLSDQCGIARHFIRETRPRKVAV
jgi:hypothetical protein